MVVDIKRNEDLLSGSNRSLEPVTIHNVHIIDASGSMFPGKYREAIDSVNAELRELHQAQKEDNVIFTNTIVEFGDPDRIDYTCFMSSLDKTPTSLREGQSKGMTALRDAVGDCITRIRAVKKPNDKVLVKILTDGEENRSRIWSQRGLQDLLRVVQENEGFTVTGMATQQDAQAFVDLGLFARNVIVHNNTAEDIKTKSLTRGRATVMYAKSMVNNSDKTDAMAEFFQEEDSFAGTG